jgi:single-strand DNA-binding protein
MATLNKVFLIGNLTKDPEVRHTPSGAAVADMRVAVSRRFKAGNGEMRDETCFVNVTAWNRQAETCGEYLSKGSPLMVEGRLKFDEWEKEGQKQSRLSVVAERVQFLGGARQRDESDRPPLRDEPPMARNDAPPPMARNDAPPVARNTAPPPPAAPADDDDLPF